MLGYNATPGTVFEKLPQTFMKERQSRPDRRTIVKKRMLLCRVFAFRITPSLSHTEHRKDTSQYIFRRDLTGNIGGILQGRIDLKGADLIGCPF